MKKIILSLMLLCLCSTSAYSALKVIGRGATLRLDPSAFPPDMKASYAIMQAKCTNAKCHTMERAVVALQTGIAPVSGQPFDRSATKAYGIKMLRKPDSNMNKQEVKAVVELMNYLLDHAGN